MKIGVVITAGGMGRRMGEPKQFLPLLGRPMVELTVEAFSKVSEITEIVLVVEPENFDRCKNYNVKLAKSGKERISSFSAYRGRTGHCRRNSYSRDLCD